MHKLPLFEGQDDVPVTTLLDLATKPAAAFRAGSVKLLPHQRVPAEGVSTHLADEISLIVRGSLTGASGGERFEVQAGEVSLIPAGEEHWAVAGPEGAEVFWCWFGDLGD